MSQGQPHCIRLHVWHEMPVQQFCNWPSCSTVQCATHHLAGRRTTLSTTE